MKFFGHSSGVLPRAVIAIACMLLAGSASAQDYTSLGISDVVASANRMLQRGDYRSAIPALQEVVRRTEGLTDLQGRETAQNARFQLARALYQVNDTSAGMQVLEEYLKYEPRSKERLALRMMAQGLFDAGDWVRIEELSNRLLAMPDLEKEDVYNANLMLGQALFRQEKWAQAVKPLEYAANAAKESRVRELCQVMTVRSLVEAKNWRQLFGKLPAIYRTDSKYDIMLNLTLMKAGKALYEENDFLNALLLYRWVLPRSELVDHATEKIRRLEGKLQDDAKRGITDAEIEERKTEIADIRESMKALEELPPYEDEVMFRIGQIYAEVKRYWEGYVLFDKLYQQDRSSEIGEAAMLQSVIVLYEVGVTERAEQRILQYLEERPDGRYTRALISMMVRDNMSKENVKKVIGLKGNLDNLPPADDETDHELESDIRYMTAFAFFQNRDFKSAEEQFSIILKDFPGSSHGADSVYFRGMALLMQGKYQNALTDFVNYRKSNPEGEYAAPALFRIGVCNFGMENVPEAFARFTEFIEMYPSDELVSEAYSMRADIEAAKEATEEDPLTLDRALVGYRKAIDTATTPLQASYAAFQAAKVYKLEYKWQDIIDLMNYYLDLFKDEADVAEAVFWIGQAKIELGIVDEAVDAYLDAVERFGDDPSQLGVDKIIYELINVADLHMDEAERDGLGIKLKLELTNIDQSKEVLKLRLEVAQAMLQGDDVAAAMGAELLEEGIDLAFTTPAALSLMCDAAVATGNVDEMLRLHGYFVDTYGESDLLWHALRARAHAMLAQKDYWGALAAIDEAQSLFGAEPFMGWAQLLKADTHYTMEKFEDAEEDYNMVLGVPEWRGPLYAEATYGMGKCKVAIGQLEAAHSLFQRIYLLYKSYSNGDWAAKGYLAAADVLIKLGREQDAINTLKAMLEDSYTNTNPMAEQVRKQLSNYGGN